MQLEVGDMILWNDPDDQDIGWIVHTEQRRYSHDCVGGVMLYIVWAKNEAETETIWEEYLLKRSSYSIVKGERHD